MERRKSYSRFAHWLKFLGVAAVLSWLSVSPAVALDPFPLKPPDTSSPQATFRSFVDNMRMAAETSRNRDDFSTLEEWNAATDLHIDRALRCLDLSKFPAAQKDVLGFEAALYLVEIFDRIALPKFEDIPGRDVSGTAPSIWVVPNTEIAIGRVEEGRLKGQYLFTSETLLRAPKDFEKARKLPYKSAAIGSIHEVWVKSAGPWIEPDWLAALPDWTSKSYLGLPLWQWISSLACIVVAIAVGYGAYRLGMRADRRRTIAGSQARLGRLLAIGVVIVLTLLCSELVVNQIKITGQIRFIAQVTFELIVIVGTGWLVTLVMNMIAEAVIGNQKLNKQGVDAQMIRVGFRVLNFVVIIYLVFLAVETVGVSLTPVLAGLGVGGLAFALAARPTLENFIGGMILFADKPVRVGDFCRYGNEIGVVEEIGLRSTRIRSLARTIVTVPNAEFSQMKLENYARRDQILFRTTVELRRETTPDQLQTILKGIRETLVNHGRVAPEPARVRLVGFGSYSLDLDIFAYITTSNFNEFLALRQELLLTILEIVHDAGTALARPVRVNVSPDTGAEPEEPSKSSGD